MTWFTRLIDAASQWMVGAPIAVQMLVLAVTAVPALIVAAWVLMWIIDHIRFGTRMGSHVDP
ncbi:hypothetical protein [uncultured Corynebacterium sp.]|uniref:hypothetical protein n=1 Tax=uncultured Corynebacterium sp. TaxID=159447 RepID=UPI0025E09B7E|nr:hypothetical protein [uncultured Corynebacterium sp.]